MSKVVIDMTMSLDGFVAGPDDGKANPLGRHGGEHIFDWYFSGEEEYRDPVFRPEPGVNLDEVERMFEESGAFIFGRRTYDITRDGWRPISHGQRAYSVFVMTHAASTVRPHPEQPSNLTFVTESGIDRSAMPKPAPSPVVEVVFGHVKLSRPRLTCGPKHSARRGRPLTGRRRPCPSLAPPSPFDGGGVRLFDRSKTASSSRSCRSVTDRLPRTCGLAS